MENVCKDCGIFLLNNQEVCPCCGWVKDVMNRETDYRASKKSIDSLVESLTDNVVPDHFSGY